MQAESTDVRLKRMEEASKASRGRDATQMKELSPAESEKESGNDSFKKKDYEKVSNLPPPPPSTHIYILPH
jgi:hypothetical protein